MAESESIDCPCSNIAIMQLFHELKQRYPTVPDQLVSKVIQENYHDKIACETILQKESHAYLQSYPGAIISGNSKDTTDRGSLCTQCPAARPPQRNNSRHSAKCVMPNAETRSEETSRSSNGSSSEESSIYNRKVNNPGRTTWSKHKSWKEDDKPKNPFSQEKTIGKIDAPKLKASGTCKVSENVNGPKKNISEDESEDKIEPKGVTESASETSVGTTETKGYTADSDSNSLTSSRTFCSDCDSDGKVGGLDRSHSCELPSRLKGGDYTEVETVRWQVEDGGRKSGGSSGVITRQLSSEQIPVHNYQVAVEYSMQPGLPFRQGDQQRSFTSVNLSLRPPSSEPQPPIEIQSGQNLTYTTSVYDAKKGVQSQLQIRIGPALLEKQRERKDLLARELRKEKEKLRCMQNEVRLMKVSIAQKPSPHLLPKLKAEIERLRAECKKLTAAVDLYSDTQNSLPLGETDEEFYRNIYTGQMLQREGSWSCQLCTFRNHPLLSFCEECEMPRLSLGTQVIDVPSHFSNVLSNNNTSFCTGGGTSTSASLITAPLQER